MSLTEPPSCFDTAEDQTEYEAEHRAREYQWAGDLFDILMRLPTDSTLSDTDRNQMLCRAISLSESLAKSLAPRPPITPTGSIEDVSWSDE